MARSNTANSGHSYYDLVIGVISTSDASYTLRAAVYLTSLNVVDSSNDLTVSGSGWWRTGVAALNGAYNASLVWSQDVVVDRVYGSDVGLTVNASWSGVEYWGATLSASASYTVPARPYSVPAAPTGVSAARNSDTSHTVTWTNHPTTAAPYTNVVVQRSEDDGGWATIATVAATATSYTNTTTSADHAYVWRVIAGNSSGYSTPAASITLYTTPAAPGTPAAVKSGSNIVLTFTNAARYDVGVKVYESQNGGAFNLLATVATANLTTYTHAAPSSSVTHAYRVATYNGTLISSQSAASNTVQLLAAPNAPTGLGPSTIRDSTDAVTWHWTHNPVDSTAQTAFQLRHRPAGGAWTTVTVTSGASTWTLPGGTYANPLTVEWQVATKGSYATYSPWSATASSPTSTRPTVTISTPADASVVAQSAVTVAWTFYDAEGSVQAAWQASLLDSAGTTVETRSGTDTASATFTTTLADATSWSIRMFATDASGMVSLVDEVAFTVAYPPPSVPVLDATWHPDTASVALGIDNPSPAPPITYDWLGTAHASASSEIVEAVVRTNRCTNPRAGVNLTGWSANTHFGATIARSTTVAPPGLATSVTMTIVDAVTGGSSSSVYDGPYWLGTLPAGTYTYGFWLMTPQTGVSIAVAVQLAGGARSFASAVTLVADTWTWVEHPNVVTPAGSTYALLSMRTATAGTVINAVHMISAGGGVYFDGDTPDYIGEVEAVSNEVYRAIDDGPFVLIATGVPPNTTITDWAPTVAGTTHYRVDAVSALPSVASSADLPVVTPQATDPHPSLWLSAGPGFSQVCRGMANIAVGATARLAEKVLRRYAGRTRPVEHAGTGTDRAWSVSLDAVDALTGTSSPADWLALSLLPGPHLLRTPDGLYAHGSLSTVGADRPVGGVVTTVAFTFTETDDV